MDALDFVMLALRRVANLSSLDKYCFTESAISALAAATDFLASAGLVYDADRSIATMEARTF